MIYECPSCQMPQEAGQTICPRCYAQFDGPVPADAVVPSPPSVKTANPESDIAAERGIAAETDAVKKTDAETDAAAEAEADTAPTLVEVKPPPDVAAPPAAPIPPPPAASEPYLGAPAFPPPSYEASAPASISPFPPIARLSRVLLIAFPIVLVLVLGGVFYANSLNTDSDTPPAAPPTVRSIVPAAAPVAPVGTPTILTGGGSSNGVAQDPRAALLAGHWVARSGEFYLFNSDGTGSRGNPAQQKPDQSFLWGLSQNRLMLYGDQNVPLRFNRGPDNNTIFLALPSGHYLQFSRSKT